jgi:hypothetical protein
VRGLRWESNNWGRMCGRGKSTKYLYIKSTTVQGLFIVQGQCARHSPSPCKTYFFGLETCSELLAQTLYFIDVCTAVVGSDTRKCID